MIVAIPLNSAATTATTGEADEVREELMAAIRQILVYREKKVIKQDRQIIAICT